MHEILFNMLFEDYAAELQTFDSKWDMLQFLIELGKELPEFDVSKKTDLNKVPGCVSEVFIDVRVREGKIQLAATADAHIVRGYCKIYIDCLNGMQVSDFLERGEHMVQEFISKTGVDSSHLASRANSFGNMFLFIKEKVAGHDA